MPISAFLPCLRASWAAPLCDVSCSLCVLQRVLPKLCEPQGLETLDIGDLAFLLLCLAALREGVDGDRRHGGEPHERADRKESKPPVPPLGNAALTLELPLAAPGQDRLGEDVVENLVARAVP